MHVGSDHLSRYGGGCVELHLSRGLLQRCASLKVLHLELLLLLLAQGVDGDGLSRHLSSQRLRSHPRLLLLLLGVWRHLPSLSLNLLLLLLLLLNHLLNGLGLSLSLSLMLLHHLLLLLLKQLHPGLMHLVLLLLLVLGLLLLLLL